MLKEFFTLALNLAERKEFHLFDCHLKSLLMNLSDNVVSLHFDGKMLLFQE